MSQLTVKIAFDTEAKVWATWDSQVPGLTAIDPSKAGLLDQIEKVVPELLELSQNSSRLGRDKQYDIVVVEQAPPTYVEQPTTTESHTLRHFALSN